LSINHLAPIDEKIFLRTLKRTIFASDGFTDGDHSHLITEKFGATDVPARPMATPRPHPIAMLAARSFPAIYIPLLSVMLQRSSAIIADYQPRAMQGESCTPATGRAEKSTQIGRRMSPFEAS
jgi:hypothetical protein